jgi:hypothetical protein
LRKLAGKNSRFTSMRVPNNSEELNKMINVETLLQENLKTSQETLKAVKKINRYILWQRILGWTKFFLIMIPLVLAFIYLPGYIRKAYDLYEQVLSPFSKSGGTSPIKNIEGLMEQLQGLSNQINLDQLKEQLKK